MNTHYKIGMNTLILAIFAGISGGIAALFVQFNAFFLVLGELSNRDFIQNLPQTHARMMVFFVLQPALMLGLGSWFVPILIKTKDMAFKWLSFLAFICLLIGFACNFLTFLYPQIVLLSFYSLVFWSVAALMFSANMLITIINTRAKEVGYDSLSIFVWGQGIASALLLPIASVLLAALTKDYFNAEQLGAAVQQTVNSFAYPMVIVLIIPAISLIFHIVGTISNQTIKQVRYVILTMTLVPLVVLLAWNKMILSHQVITLHQGFMLQIFYSCALYGLSLYLFIYCLRLFFTGERRFPAPILWSFGFIGLLSIGWPYQGIMSEIGLMHSCISYGVLFAVFAGFYFWMGKILGKQYSEFLAKLHFTLTCVGVVFTLDMFSLGSKSILIGAIFMGLSLLTFFIVLIHALSSKVSISNNYWGAGAVSYEWQLPSPVFSRAK
ncbi:cbb3-type cytochrome c oxidase subunit I [Commensalibacter nepenthis]|uniref:Cbb3-type cytochrome c oxidase subunit I n=1 Tax=Commensalibacter nepenthis TaxID=3043872 RepID=A0ABT6QA47_9PROT|nr:cbb3-type cytochrome c oxidase subunit I [Commensalibacter sp. TBRC 10068]MDI2113632.1 cbb3-type cytochrome c oxidase subunit I [Commensalibacter sp. TBRC 10068]